MPAVFPALPACLLPAGNPAWASLSTAARVRGRSWGHESGFTPHSWVALAVARGAWGWHCTVAPVVHHKALEEVLEEGPAVTEDTLLPPPVHPWAVWGAVWHGYGAVLPTADTTAGRPSCPWGTRKGKKVH